MSFPRSGSYYGSYGSGDNLGSSPQQFGSGPRLNRQGSFGNLRESLFWWGQGQGNGYMHGEQPQTQFLEQNLAAHTAAAGSTAQGTPLLRPSSLSSLMESEQTYTIRFQVIVWSIGSPDVKSGKVSMKFRVTLFWNDPPPPMVEDDADIEEAGADECSSRASSESRTAARRKSSVWVMSGRHRAYEKNLPESTVKTTVDVPPVSILNADSFEVIGQPEVSLLRDDTRLMRWSCMYRAQLHQDDMRVHDFPHDKHNLCIKLGILSQRHSPGGQWDRRKWKLALANQSDTQRSIATPYGLLVDHVRIPEFHFDKVKGLDFDLVPLKYGAAAMSKSDKDYYLKTTLTVTRDAGYYDKNIMPVLCMLNLVAISILCLDATYFFNRGLMTLNIAFLEIGLRMTLDSHLPNVGYQIKMQRVLNWFFYSILSIVVESSILKYCVETEKMSLQRTRDVDFIVAVLLIVNQIYLTVFYVRRAGEDTEADAAEC